jgi:hypothetical protein
MRKIPEKKSCKLEAGQLEDQQIVELEELLLEKLITLSYHLIRVIVILSLWFIQDKLEW